MVLLIPTAVVIALVAALGIPLALRFDSPLLLANLGQARKSLLTVAGVFSGLLALICLAAAAWGMNTRLPWGLGYFMWLTPTLALPAFLLLKLGPVRLLSSVLWTLTFASSIAFYYGDRADRVAYHLKPITDRREQVGMVFNAFTISLLAIALLVQMAALCASRESRIVRPI